MNVQWLALLFLFGVFVPLLLAFDAYRNLRNLRTFQEASDVSVLRGLAYNLRYSDLASSAIELDQFVEELCKNTFDRYLRFSGRIARVRLQTAARESKESIFVSEIVRSNFARALDSLHEAIDKRSKTLLYESLSNLYLSQSCGEGFWTLKLLEAKRTEKDVELLKDLLFCAGKLENLELYDGHDCIMKWSEEGRLDLVSKDLLLCLSYIRDRAMLGATDPRDTRVSLEEMERGRHELAGLIREAVQCLDSANYARLIDVLVTDQERILSRQGD